MPTFSRRPSITAHVYFSSSASFSIFAAFFSSLVMFFFFSRSSRWCMYILVKSHFLNSLMCLFGPFLSTRLKPSKKFFTKTSFCA